MRKGTAFAVLIGGIIVALLAGAITFRWLQKRTIAQTGAVATQPVVVAAVNLTWGKVLDAMQVKTVPFLKGSLPQECFSRPSEVAGRTLLYPVREGEPLFESQLAPASVKGGGVSALISKNKRAMAVKVDKVVGVSGYINPGNRVDVLVTVNRQAGDKQSPVTKAVLGNVLVLTVGSEMEKTEKQEKPAIVDVITLEVTPEEGEKLALAAAEGKVVLALRNPTDSGEVATTGATIPELLASSVAPAPAHRSAPVHGRTVARPATTGAAAVAGLPKPMFLVQGIRGTTVSEYKFEKEE
jgi:pilus assembly protein CpaB